MTANRVASFLVALLVLTPGLAVAQANDDENRFAVSFFVGLDPVVAGQFNRETETSGIFGTDRLFDHSFGQVYAAPLRLSTEMSYAVAHNTEVIGALAIRPLRIVGSWNLVNSSAAFLRVAHRDWRNSVTITHGRLRVGVAGESGRGHA